jgi:hypothetical protein
VKQEKEPGLIIDDLSASTSHASDSELDSSIIKPVIVNTTCLDNLCLNNCVMPKSKDTGTQAHGKLSLLVIIVGRLVILGQIVIC